ncbi:hypothetical protein GCM10017673_33920 [Streptosporangium violaceochromogenes]|nr:hypothetical protein GCM10017673_33920 [Streptosporangium violaceochromogenes]
MPRKKPKAAPARERLSEKAPTRGTTHTSKVQSGADNRSNPALPGLVTAETLPPAPGRTRVVLIVRACPRCDGIHLHHTRWPTPSLITRRAGCGHRYEVIPYVRRTKKRAAR